MSRNQKLQELISSIPSFRTQQKNILCRDCGGISTTKIQQLLSTLEGTTQLFNTTSISNKKKQNLQKKKSSARNNSRKSSSVQRKKNKIIHKRISNSTKQRKLNTKKIRSKIK
jgi:hypothetical protein